MNDYSPGVLSLLPIFYIGWSDSVLSPSEMKFIKKQISALDFLSKEERDYLNQYTNPTNPPDQDTFKTWLEALRKHAKNATPGEKKDLSELGLEIAKSAISYKSEELWNAPKVYLAIKEIEESLGIESEDNLATMINHLDAKQIVAAEHTASFDSSKMAMILDGTYYETKRKIKKLLRDPEFSADFFYDKQAYRDRILQMLQNLSDQGYGALAFDKQYGGGGSMGDYMAVFETLAYHDNSLTVKFGVQFGLFGGAINGLGTERHHRKYIEPLGKGDLLGCFAMTETGHGSNVKDLETTATYIPEEDAIEIHSPTLTAGKEYIGNALHGSMAVVFAQLIVDRHNHGIHAVIVPYRDSNGNALEGITVKDCGYKMGLNGVDNGRLWFDKVRVPRENLLNKFGDISPEGSYISAIENPNKRFFSMLGALVGGRICVGLAGLNATKTSLSIAMRYAMKRRQFSGESNDPQEWLIMDYPTHQKRLIPLLSKTYIYYIALSNLVDDYTSNIGGDMRKIETKAAGLKAMATWHTTHTIQVCREACGGKGYLAENRISSFKADTDIFTTFEGDNTVLLQLVAKGLLTEFKQSFHDDGSMAIIRYLSKKLSFTLSELNPVNSRNTSVEHLLSEEFLSDALRYREKKLLITLSDRMRSFLSKRLTPFEAFLKCQNHMVELAKAYIERLAFRETLKKLDTLENGSEKTALLNMNKLYALTIIEEHKGYYLENDYMDGSKTKAIRKVINKLMQQMRPDYMALIDSFDIPFESIGAQIVLGDEFKVKNQ